MRTCAITAALALMLTALAGCSAGAITIDGNMDDWPADSAVYEMPEEALAAVQSPFGAVERLWVMHDDTFLYFRVRFERPRPFTDEAQSEFQEGYLANRRYIQLDVTGDGQADFWTTQIDRGGVGFNRTYVVDLRGERPTTYLWYEGHATWTPETGPMGHYSPDGREIEIRVPREPLDILGTTVGVQVKMSLRDGIEGPGVWTNDLYPSADTFFLYDIATATAVEPAEPTGPPSLTMIRTDAAPAIDGDLDDAAWDEAPVLDGFLLNRGYATPEAQTRAQITWDDRALYLAVRAEEPRMDLLKTDAVEAEARRVWSDDLIELFVGSYNDGTTFTQLGMTAAGATVGRFNVVRGAARTSIDIEPEIDVAWKHEDDHWILEAAIGWGTFGVRPRAGEIWALNVNRGRPHAGEYSSWAGVQGSFLQPAAFGETHFPHEDGLRVINRGMAARAGNAGQANVLVAELAGAPLTGSVAVSAAGRESFSDTATAAADEALELPYVVTGDAGETVAFVISSEGTTLYEATIPVVQTDFPKVWVTEDPVFEELLGDEGPGMAAEGVLYWSHDLTGYSIAPVVIKHAQPWTLRESYEMAAEHNLHFFDGGTLLGNDPFETRKFAEKLGVRVIAMGSQRAGTEDTPRGNRNYAYIIDYDNQEVYLERLRDFVREWREYIWGVSTGDEVQDHQLTLGLRLHYEGDEPYPFMQQVDREVREEFGYGQFGIPEALDDRNPFRWIAYRRWYNDRFADFQRRIYEMIKEIDEDLVVVGPDPISQIQPFDYSGHGPWCDVVTHQTYPRGAREQDTVWITKTVRDLSGGAAVMPCTHVENYANSFRPDEVVELMSQVYRGGGEGFHLYLPDTSGRRTSHSMELDRFGSWTRHEAIMGVLEMSRTMNRPVLPESSAAVLFSNDAYMAEFLGGRQGNDPYRWMFQLIGPYAGGWFTVISDNQIGRDEIDLSQFSTIYLPEAQYQRREVAEALASWVAEGGRLIVTDPEAFTWHLDGSRMDDLRATLFPAIGETNGAEAVVAAADCPVPVAGALSVFSDAAPLELADGDRALLAYDDGSVAAAARTVGEGEVWFFGFDPMSQGALGSEWVAWWTAVHQHIGEQTDLPIWRFTLPVEVPPIAPPRGRCLTGNYLVWDTNEAIPMANVTIDGTYSYSVAPDYVPDEGGVEDIPFAEGDLMDRRSALTHQDEDYAAHLQKFAVGWNATDPITIEFDLGEAFPLDRVWLLMSGSHPSVEVTGLVDGQWQSLGSVEGRPVEFRHDYPEFIVEIAEDAPPVRRLRLEIAAREEGQRLIIPEIEIWARE